MGTKKDLTGEKAAAVSESDEGDGLLKAIVEESTVAALHEGGGTFRDSAERWAAEAGLKVEDVEQAVKMYGACNGMIMFRTGPSKVLTSRRNGKFRAVEITILRCEKGEVPTDKWDPLARGEVVYIAVGNLEETKEEDRTPGRLEQIAAAPEHTVFVVAPPKFVGGAPQKITTANGRQMMPWLIARMGTVEKSV